MEQMATIGLDIAKSVFQLYGIGNCGSVVVQRRLRRSQVLAFFSKQPRCVAGIEACASSHFWAREIGALGHEFCFSRSSLRMKMAAFKTHREAACSSWWTSSPW